MQRLNDLPVCTHSHNLRHASGFSLSGHCSLHWTTSFLGMNVLKFMYINIPINDNKVAADPKKNLKGNLLLNSFLEGRIDLGAFGKKINFNLCQSQHSR